MEKLFKIQQTLKAPKDLYNKFGEYKYRSCESILEALKPLLSETKTVLTITDDLVQLGERFYVRATATLYDSETGKELHHCQAYAREVEAKTKMDAAQITGAASSYARKYALNGLFCIDDVKDPDATNKHGKDEEITENQEISTDKPVCPKCGKKTTQGALNNWGMCGECYRASKKENK